MMATKYDLSDLGEIKKIAGDTNRTVEQTLSDFQEAGWAVDPRVMNAWQRELQTNPYAKEQERLGRPLTDDEQQMLSSQALGSVDPLASAAKNRALATIGGVDPAAYEAYGRQFADQRQAYADQLAGRTAEYDQGLAQLYNYATGAQSAVQRQADIEREMLARNRASQIASAPGGYNPAIVRGAYMAETQAAADLGARASALRMQEQQQAADAYMRGLGAASAADTSGQATLGQLLSQQSAQRGAADAMRGGLYGMATGNQNVFVNPATQLQMQANQFEQDDSNFWRNFAVQAGTGAVKGIADIGTSFGMRK